VTREDVIEKIMVTDDRYTINGFHDTSTDDLLVIWKTIEAQQKEMGGLIAHRRTKFEKVSKKTIFIRYS